MDIVSFTTRSRMMAGIRSKNTRPEIELRKFIHSHGFRYRLNSKILNIKPDIVLAKYKTVIFVNGCFWHRHCECKYSTNPQTSQEKWQKKFSENIARDKRAIKTLVEAGWRVVVIWECWRKRKMDISWLPDWIRSGEAPCVIWPKVNDFPAIMRKGNDFGQNTKT